MIYFVRRADGAIKIGTTETYHTRLMALKSQCGTVELLGLMEGGWPEEQALHQQFGHIRLHPRKEWFRPELDLLGFIETRTHKRLPPKVIKQVTVPVKESTHERLRDFTYGLGATFDGALNFLLYKVIGDQDPFVARGKLRKEYKEGK